METQAQKRANAKYRAEKVKQLNVKFFPKDIELYKYAKSHKNVGEYIRSLIRRDLDNLSVI